MSSPLLRLRPDAVSRDVLASIVVFLVAVPLCVGIAVASGVPAELGLITGIVGGLVAGAMPGSSLQVSGPAAGLTVLVYEAVTTHGVATLGILVLATGLLQIGLGLIGFGRWFRAISTAVVHGMLAGIGLVLISSQLYAMAAATAPGTGLDNLAGLPDLLPQITGATAISSTWIGIGTIAVLIGWKRLPGRLPGNLPGPLVAVGLATAAVWLFDLPVATIEVRGLIDSMRLTGLDEFGLLTNLGLLGVILAFTLIASAESLFSATAVDRMHDGPRTHYNKELIAQGAGNTFCGLLGALPMTAVIVRSAANVQAGARTKASRILHGVWLLLFAALFPATLGMIPVAALAGILVHAGAKLIPVTTIPPLWREHRGEAIVLMATALAIILTDMFTGVLLGIGLAVVKTAWETSAIRLDVNQHDDRTEVALSGCATFLRLPFILDTLEALPKDRPVELDLSRLRHLDHACHTALEAWGTHNSTTKIPVPVAEQAPR
ncbi:SulP family inorganic anion transporter [Streptomyces cyaneofuscatus]|uniref:SulP family inorganic anion transporter n=1 Tax=Streptomyces cyaneofuscatus TaxID=66883 RepID=UPI002D792ECB|nr:SulP family inorganic anion transporter [Streptomyces cyaneofuscatus]WRO10315.1 SulP family inorganic anion transporter [Streptomyces cyaneofuscatus]